MKENKTHEKTTGETVEKNEAETQVHRKPDGTTIKRKADGSIVKRKADGTIIKKKADGTIIHRKPDGTILRKRAKPSSEPEAGSDAKQHVNTEKRIARSAEASQVQDSQPGEQESGKSKISKNPRAKKNQRVSKNPETKKAETTQLNKGRRTRKPGKKRKGLAGCLIVLIILLGIGSAGAFALYRHYGPSKERADLKNYYGLENESQLAIVLNEEVIEEKGIVDGGQAYLPYDVVTDSLNDRIYWDAKEHLLLYSLPEETISIPLDATEYTVGGETKKLDYTPVKMEGDLTYIALDFIKEYTNMSGKFYQSPNRAVVQTLTGKVKVATVKKDTQVRFRGGVKSPILTDVKKGDKVTVIENEDNWKKVCTTSGFIGYLRDNKLKNEKNETLKSNYTEPEYTSIQIDHTICMAWHQVTSEAANDTLSDVLSGTSGLNTIAPTWFTVSNKKGDITSIATKDYVSKAHKRGIDVWAVVNDFDGGINSTDETFAVLSSTSHRKNLVSSLISFAKKAGVDGINVDLEKISKECGEHYIQFLRELSIACRKEKLVLSIDNYVPKNFNAHYHRDEQGVIADYVVIMGYDEHYGGSYEAGSVASIDYVKEGIEETLKEVPKNKVINAIPFYTRLWYETPKSEKELAAEEGTEAADYPNKVTSETLDMKTAAATVKENKAKASWDKATQQHYAEWKDKKGVYKIWLEDRKSIQAKLDFMKEKELAGVSAWKLGYETPDVWKEISAFAK